MERSVQPYYHNSAIGTSLELSDGPADQFSHNAPPPETPVSLLGSVVLQDSLERRQQTVDQIVQSLYATGSNLLNQAGMLTTVNGLDAIILPKPFERIEADGRSLFVYLAAKVYADPVPGRRFSYPKQTTTITHPSFIFAEQPGETSIQSLDDYFSQLAIRYVMPTDGHYVTAGDGTTFAVNDLNDINAATHLLGEIAFVNGLQSDRPPLEAYQLPVTLRSRQPVSRITKRQIQRMQSWRVTLENDAGKYGYDTFKQTHRYPTQKEDIAAFWFATYAAQSRYRDISKDYLDNDYDW